MMMFNSANLGALIVKQDPEVKSWEDNFYGIQSIGIDEQYGFGIINDGQAIAVARNVRVVPNEFVLPARTVRNRGISQAALPGETVSPCRLPPRPGAAAPPHSAAPEPRSRKGSRQQALRSTSVKSE